jgi:thiol:disulfide interchange protein
MVCAAQTISCGWHSAHASIVSIASIDNICFGLFLFINWKRNEQPRMVCILLSILIAISLLILFTCLPFHHPFTLQTDPETSSG